MDELIEKTKQFVKDYFAGEASGHDAAHTIRVYRMARRLAREEHADERITSLAALLHDVDDAKLSPETAASKARARAFMEENGVSEPDINAVIDIISHISFAGSGSDVPSSTEGKCVQDADRLDAIGAIGIARAFAYGGSRGRPIHDPESRPREKMTEEEYRKGGSTTVDHFYEKLFKLKGLMNTPSARLEAERRDRIMHDFIDELLEEWEGE
ncbi:MAG: HD domain-containing protein [Clostridia bacterium]|nr:HD domain-containing protein [Clostridia bacterium]